MRIEKLRNDIHEELEENDFHLQDIKIDELDGNRVFLEFVFDEHARACGYYNLQSMPKAQEIISSLEHVEDFLPEKEKVDENASAIKKFFANTSEDEKDNFIFLLKKSEVPEEGFSNNTSVQKFIIHGDLKSIGRRAFAGCFNLKVVYAYGSSGLVEIGEEAFDGCCCLNLVDLSKCLEIIGDYAFHECESLREFSVPKNVKYIGKGAFEGCIELVSFDIKDYTLLNKADIFKNCPNLKQNKFKKNLSTDQFDLCFGTDAVPVEAVKEHAPKTEAVSSFERISKDRTSMTSPSINPDNTENRQSKSFNKKIIWIVVAVILLLWLFLR